ncbi:MAG: hypothetical protein JWN14_3933 [Chthonomonadales bacterium]|nr:hypothetical protein [Chthonomonadales bacterium]
MSDMETQSAPPSAQGLEPSRPATDTVLLQKSAVMWLTLVSLLCVVCFCGYQVWRAQALEASHSMTSGTLMRVTKIQTKGGLEEYFLYQYAVNGRMYDDTGTVPDRIGSHFSVGQEIPVVYLAEKPQIAMYRDYDDSGEMKWVFVFFCILFAGALVSVLTTVTTAWLRRRKADGSTVLIE